MIGKTLKKIKKKLKYYFKKLKTSKNG